MSKRGFIFSTKNNSYYYNDIDGNVELCDRLEMPEIYFGNSNESLPQISKETVDEFLSVSGYRVLVLIVTEACNLRCKYCVYSENYEDFRGHSSKNMSFDTAKKAIDEYFKEIDKLRIRFPLVRPVISFYGGEPLVNIGLIVEIFNYIDSLGRNDVSYTLTTNATLLNDSILEKLSQKKVMLLISINGDEIENDRMRVYPDGRGTYKEVDYWVNKLADQYTDYYQNYVLFSSVFDPMTDLNGLQTFFETPPYKGKLLNIAAVIQDGSTWYEQYEQPVLDKFVTEIQKMLNGAITKIIDDKQNSRESRIHCLQKRLLIGDFLCVLGRQRNLNMNPFGNSCIPGLKIAVDVEGKIYTCERCNSSRPIGDVNTWLDKVLIADLVNDFNSTIRSNCINCPVSRLCPTCIKSGLQKDGNYDISQINCKGLIQGLVKTMATVYECNEYGVDLEQYAASSPIETEARRIELS